MAELTSALLKGSDVQPVARRNTENDEAAESEETLADESPRDREIQPVNRPPLRRPGLKTELNQTDAASNTADLPGDYHLSARQGQEASSSQNPPTGETGQSESQTTESQSAAAPATILLPAIVEGRAKFMQDMSEHSQEVG